MTTTAHQLVEQYVPLANKLAYQKKARLPKFIELEELQSAAYLGLVQAASRFDASLGIAFSTFAYPRIFGAIHDYLRSQGLVRRGDFSLVVSLDGESDGGSLKESIAAKPESDLEECFEAITAKLDEHAKSVLRRYFIDECSMKEVGDKFGVSESRISQLIKEYKRKIQSETCYADLAA